MAALETSVDCLLLDDRWVEAVDRVRGRFPDVSVVVDARDCHDGEALGDAAAAISDVLDRLEQ